MQTKKQHIDCLIFRLLSDRLTVMGKESIPRRFEPAYEGSRKPDLKAVFDALSDAGSLDGCDPDWCAEVMEKALPEDVERVRSEFLRGGTEREIARRLNVWPR